MSSEGKIEVRLAGFGGQGIVLAGMILGKAITLYEGANAVMTQSYGPEARGGACSADVIISKNRINYPRVTTPDILVLMSEEAARTYGSNTVEGALVLVNKDLVKTLPEESPLTILQVPATGIAEELGRRIVANVVMVGFFSGATGLISPQAGEQAIRNTLRPRLVELNLKAFNAGYDYAKKQEAS